MCENRILSGHLFEVILPPFVAVGDMQGIQVFQGTSVISEGHLGYPLQDLVQLLLTQGLGGQAKTRTAVKYTVFFWEHSSWFRLNALLHCEGI